MKRLILAFLVLCALPARAQPPGIVWSGGGGGSGSADPSQFSSAAGTVTIGGSVGAVTIDADTSVIPTYATGTSLPATCTPFATSFLDTDSTTTLAYDCIGTNTWAGRFTIADDAVLVGTGTTTASATIPDCDDSAGNHLNYDTATNTFSCGTSGGGSFDPSMGVTTYEDFLGGTSASGLIGTEGWNFVNLASGTNTAVDGTAGHPGIWRVTSSASDDSGAILALGPSGISARWSNFGAVAGTWAVDYLVNPGSNSTGITTYAIYAGLSISGSSSVSATSNYFGLRYDTDASDTTFMFIMCNASGASGCASAADAANMKVNASTVTPSAGTWYRVRLRYSSTEGPGSTPKYAARVNNETEVTWCSSGCTDTIVTPILYYPIFMGVARTTSVTRSTDIDYAMITITYAAARY